MKVLLSSEQIQARVAEMGREIARDYAGREPHLVGVLNGACTFMTDLARGIDLPLTLDFIAVASVCPGDSGGPAFSPDANEVVGVTSASVMDGDELTEVTE